MRRRAASALLLLALGACSRAPGGGQADVPGGSGAALENAAIAGGLIPDPDSADISGLYTRATDSVCVVPAARGFRIGVAIDYGDQQRCSAIGRVDRDGQTLHVTLGDGDGCRFDARFGGDGIRFPGKLPGPCDALCTGRASLAGTAVDRLSDSVSEANALRDPRGRLLCGDE